MQWPTSRGAEFGEQCNRQSSWISRDAQATSRSMREDVLVSAVTNKKASKTDCTGHQTTCRGTAPEMLAFMAGPCFLLSVVNAIWACLVLAIAALRVLISSCSTEPTFRKQIPGLLQPTLDLQLRCIHLARAVETNEEYPCRASTLFVGHMLSPVLSAVFMLASWMLAIYWLYSYSVGDPTSTDDWDDSWDAIVWLRDCWAYWLTLGRIQLRQRNE